MTTLAMVTGMMPMALGVGSGGGCGGLSAAASENGKS